MSHDNRFSKTNYLKTNLLKQIKKYFCINDLTALYDSTLNDIIFLLKKNNYL